jgi:hypothetical protein
MRGMLEGSIKDKRRTRLLKDHPDIMNGRLTLGREAYTAYVSTVSATEAIYLPTLAGMETIPQIRAICEREPDIQVTSADFSALPSIVAEWITNKQTMLTQLANQSSPEAEASPDRFNLASTIFRCTNAHGDLGCPALFGGHEAMRHIVATCKPELDTALAEVASALVVLLGMDPAVTSVSDMDRRNARFRCDGQINYSSCVKKKNTFEVFTWRGCVSVIFRIWSCPAKHSTSSDNPRH